MKSKYTYWLSLFEKIQPPDEILGILEGMIRDTLKWQYCNQIPLILALNLYPWHLSDYIKEKRCLSELVLMSQVIQWQPNEEI